MRHGLILAVGLGLMAETATAVFDVSLDPGQEVPSPTLNGFTPSGIATVVVDASTGNIEISGSYAGMTSNVVAAHLHGLAPPGVATGIIVGLTVSGGTSGTFSGAGVLTPENLAGLLDGLTYVNVHTENNGPGEIRGQIDSSQDPLVYVPADTPCRVVDTRPIGSPLVAGNPRNFFSFGPAGTINAQGGNAAGCDHPRSSEGIQPAAIAANITAVGNQATGNGNIVSYPAGGAVPGTSTVNYKPGTNIANSTLITLCTTTCPTSGDLGDFALQSNGSNVPAIVDVIGYYYPIDGEQQVTVNCPAESIQAAIDKASPDGQLTITIDGICTENVTVTRDKVKFEGSTAGGTLAGTFNIISARWIRIDNLKVTGAGPGIFATDNASFTVENSEIVANDEDGINVLNNSTAWILRNTIADNGQAQLESGAGGPGNGVLVNDSGSTDIISNAILDNRSYGVQVIDAAFAQIEDNDIERNGRLAAFEAGVGIFRARVHGNGNRYKDNPYAAISVANNSAYRTGNFLNGATNPDNLFPFEVIDRGTGQIAIELSRVSLVDLRQVSVTGNIFVGNTSQLQIRGDDVGPNQFCSTFNGDIDAASATFSVVRLRKVNVTGGVFVGPDARLLGSTVCP